MDPTCQGCRQGRTGTEMSGVFQWSRRRVSRKWCPSWGQMAMLEWMENVAEGWGKNVMGTECRWRSGRSASMPASLGHVVSGGLAQRCGCPCSIQPSHVPYPQPVAPTVMTRGDKGQPHPLTQTGDAHGQRALHGSAEDRGCSAGLRRGASRQHGPASAPEGCSPGPTPVPSLGYTCSAPAQADTALASGGTGSRKRCLQLPISKTLHAAPPAPRATPHVPC